MAEFVYGKAIEKIRIAAGLKQIDIARRTFCSQTHVSLVEAGKKKPDRRWLEKFSEVTSVPLFILFMSIDGPNISEEIKEIAAKRLPEFCNEE